ncbi:MAG: iron-siderophore ABC transporter substrate-binding protein [Actinomycetota bacterium]
MSVTPLDRPAPDVLEDLTHRESIADLINRSVSQQVIAGLTRRDFVKGGLAAGLLLGSGCNPRTGSTPEAPAGGFPVTIEHIDGSTTISSRPQRVVTVGLIEQDALLALGVVPVGATEWLDERPGAIHPWATGALGDAALPEVMSSEAIQFEQIAGLKPDLIVAIYNVTVETADYEKLSKIAPTVLAPPDVDLTSVTWQELTRIIGKAVGRQEQAEELVAQVEAKFAGTRASNPNFSGSAVNVYPTPDGAFQAYPPPDLGGQFLSALGFETPPRILELAAGKSFVDLSPEQLELLDADVIVWLLDNAAGEERLKANPLYQRMRAVTEGRAIYLNYEDKNPPIAAATSFQTVLSLPFLIDALTPRLAAALDGDPATDVT